MNYFGIVDPFYEEGFGENEKLMQSGMFIHPPEEADEMGTSFSLTDEGEFCNKYHGNPGALFELIGAVYSKLQETGHQRSDEKDVFTYRFIYKDYPYEIRDTLYLYPKEENEPDSYQWAFEVLFAGDNTVL